MALLILPLPPSFVALYNPHPHPTSIPNPPFPPNSRSLSSAIPTKAIRFTLRVPPAASSGALRPQCPAFAAGNVLILPLSPAGEDLRSGWSPPSPRLSSCPHRAPTSAAARGIPPPTPRDSRCKKEAAAAAVRGPANSRGGRRPSGGSPEEAAAEGVRSSRQTCKRATPRQPAVRDGYFDVVV
ncbi:uncharacterized protein A4U43_C08F27860 [Asparagus officinalis]|nr:uncharacterized protein A4U43_C08F27860 [Asparagus officinalis]